MWLLFAFLSAIFAATVAILAKVGLKNMDSTLATTIRSCVMFVFMLCASLSLGKFNNFSFGNFANREWIIIILSGVAGALSWLFYFSAIKYGNVNAVAAIDRLSIVFIVLMSALFIGEALTWKSGLGAILIAIGAFLITLK